MNSIGQELTDVDLENVEELDTNDNGKLEKDEVGNDYFFGPTWPLGPAGNFLNIFN